MSEEHTTQGGVDWELRVAEDAMIAAPDGSPELARAMRRHADGVRNMMQSELVPSFMHAIDTIMAKHIGALNTEMQKSARAVAARLGKIDKRVDAVVARLDTKREILAEHDRRIKALEENSERLEALEDAIAALRAASVVERDEAAGA